MRQKIRRRKKMEKQKAARSHNSEETVKLERRITRTK
jgi:hypothetical protein